MDSHMLQLFMATVAKSNLDTFILSVCNGIDE